MVMVHATSALTKATFSWKDVRAGEERERSHLPIFVIPRQPRRRLSFEMLVDGFGDFDDPLFLRANGPSEIPFDHALLGAPLRDHDPEPPSQFVFRLVPHPRWDEELEFVRREEFLPPLAKQFPDERARVHRE